MIAAVIFALLLGGLMGWVIHKLLPNKELPVFVETLDEICYTTDSLIFEDFICDCFRDELENAAMEHAKQRRSKLVVPYDFEEVFEKVTTQFVVRMRKSHVGR